MGLILFSAELLKIAENIWSKHKHMSLLTFQTMRQCPKAVRFVSDAKLEVDEM